MSQERPFDLPGGPIGGAGMTGAQNPAAPAPLPQATETDRTSEAGARASAPDLATAPPAPRAIAMPSGRRMRMADILGDPEDGEGQEQAQTGMGPRLIVLHSFVRGKTHGNVVWASDLLGLDYFRDAASDDRAKATTAQTYIRRELKRLLDLGAVREANDQEAQYEQVVFVETQEEAENALVAAQKTISEKDAEIARLTALVGKTQTEHQGSDDIPNF